MEKTIDRMTDRPSEAPRVDFVSALPHLLGTLFAGLQFVYHPYREDTFFASRYAY